MSGNIRSRWPWVLLAVVLLAFASLYLREVRRDPEATDVFVLVIVAMVMGHSTVGALLASRNPRNAIGWLMMVVGAALVVGLGADEYARYAHPRSLPLGWLAAWASVSLRFIVVFAGLALIALVFPTGRVPNPRWKHVPWIVFAFVGVTTLQLLDPTIVLDKAIDFRSPIGVAEGAGSVGSVGFFGVFGAAAASVIALIMRYRRSLGEERQQIRWLAYMAAAIGVVIPIGVATALVVEDLGGKFGGSSLSDFFVLAVGLLIGIGVPAAIGVAVLKYRLYDLDLVIRKTVVFATLVLLLLAVALIGARLVAGRVVPSLEGRSSLLLAAGAVLGLLAIPAYHLATRIADRVVYGGRASPYEVLSEFSGRVGETYSTEDVLPRMAKLLGQAARSETARVWLRIGSEFRPSAVWPADVGRREALPSRGDALPDFGDDGFEIRHQGELLGALTVEMRPSDPMTPSKERIVRDLASQAGLVLRNVRLIEELRESRRRLVTAQDERAKKLERDMHDGAQQQLVALGVKAGLLERLVGDDPKIGQLAAELRGDAQVALEDLRDLARGIYPPLLADQGLAAALAAQARKSSVPVEVDPDGIGRYAQEVESAVYFSVLEALQNVAKYSDASHATISLSQANGSLTFEVADDGRGFDPARVARGTGLQGMADRLNAIAGDLRVTSAPGQGTIVTGKVSVEART